MYEMLKISRALKGANMNADHDLERLLKVRREVEKATRSYGLLHVEKQKQYSIFFSLDM